MLEVLGERGGGRGVRGGGVRGKLIGEDWCGWRKEGVREDSSGLVGSGLVGGLVLC